MRLNLWDKIQAMVKSCVVLLPNIVLALLITFAIFFFIARGEANDEEANSGSPLSSQFRTT